MLTEVPRGEKKWSVKSHPLPSEKKCNILCRSVKAHKKGVNDIAWCQSQQWCRTSLEIITVLQCVIVWFRLASCGLGRAILLWQISISTPVFTLEGHQASVQSLCMHESSNTLISLDTDRVLNIWVNSRAHFKADNHTNPSRLIRTRARFAAFSTLTPRISIRNGPSPRAHLTATGAL